MMTDHSVPRETQDKLDRYAALLREWNERINLVAASTIPQMEQRHFLDSSQLMKFIPVTTKRLADMGSGAGFPGLVLAILGVPDVHLIESIGKKANFLKTVVEDLKLTNVTIHQERIEKIRDLNADVVTARALKALPELLSLAKPLTHRETICLFLKGQNVDAELTAAENYWTFKAKKVPSLSDPTGVVLKITDLKVAHHASRRSRIGGPRPAR